MNDSQKETESFRSLLLLDELEHGEPISQREIAGRLGIAVGLVNSYLKNLVRKGFVQVKAFPANRYAYLLTPKGFAEKSRLAYQHLSNFTRLYRVARSDFSLIFEHLSRLGVRKVAFAGVDEVAEIAYLSLQESGLELVVVADVVPREQAFISFPVLGLEDALAVHPGGAWIVTSYYRAPEIVAALKERGVDPAFIHTLGEIN